MDKNNITLLNNRAQIRQSNFITGSNHGMSAIQQNIMYMVMSQIRDDDPKNALYPIHLNELEKITGSQINYKYLRSAFNSLEENGLYKVIELNKVSTFAALTSFVYKPGSGVIMVQLSSKIRKYLFNLKDKYTLFQFKNAIKLKSKYSKRIYEMLSQFKGQYKKQKAKNKDCIINISVQELKQRFKLIDPKTGKEEYEKFAFFAKNVLKPALEEINNITEISFEYETKTTGRKITDLKFKIINVEEIETLGELTQSVTAFPKELSNSTQATSQVAQLEQRLVDEFKISKLLARDVIKSFPVEKIERVMKGILKENQEGKIKKLGAYSKTIFEEWLNGAEPTFEKTATTIKHVPLKSSTQTDEIVALEHEFEKKLAEFGLGRSTVYGLLINYGGDLGRLEELRSAISKVGMMIDKKEIASNPDSIFEALKIELNEEVKEVNQPLATEPKDRSNSMNSLGSLLASTIPRPQKQLKLSPEEEKLSKEKTALWEELIGRFGMDAEEANEVVENHFPAAINFAISKVVESAKHGKIAEESTSMIQELYKHLNLA